MASAAIGAGASLLSGVLGGKGTAKAAKAQAAAYQAGIDEQRRQFDVTQGNYAPYLAAGTQALGGYGDLTGLNGNDRLQVALDSLKASPAFTSLYNTGADTILQNAAATGGLRGGNTQNSLANFGSSLFAQTIQDRLSQLGGLVQTGVGATGALGGFGQNASSNIAGLLAQQGGANAQRIMAPYAAAQGVLNQIGGSSGGFDGLFSGGKLGGGASKASNFAGVPFPGLQSLGW